MALTGRRPAEIFFSATFRPPSEKTPYPVLRLSATGPSPTRSKSLSRLSKVVFASRGFSIDQPLAIAPQDISATPSPTSPLSPLAHCESGADLFTVVPWWMPTDLTTRKERRIHNESLTGNPRPAVCQRNTNSNSDNHLALHSDFVPSGLPRPHRPADAPTPSLH